MTAYYKTIVLIAYVYTIACKLVKINKDILKFGGWSG